MTRTLRILLAGIAVLVLVAFVALVVLNGTYYGRERVRRLALDAVRDLVHGEVVVGRIDGNLLDRFDLVDVTITDEDEQPFLTADRIRARVAIAPLLSRRIIITSIEFERPVVTISRPTGGEWNYKRIFAASDTVSTDVRFGWGSWVDLHSVTIRDGTVLVHQPFPSDEPLTKTIHDGVTRDDLIRDTRLRVEPSGSGLRQTMEFRDINARIPRLVWADPDSAAVAFRVRQLSMLAAVLRAPDVVVRDFAGDVRVAEDTVLIRNADLRLPASEIQGAVTYHSSAGDVELDLKSDTLALADMQTIYPDLPDHGGGRLDLKAVIRDTATSVYEFSNARLAVDRSHVSGLFGIAVSSRSFELRDTDLRFTRFTTDLVERLVPGLDVKVPGDFTGTAKLKGPPTGMRADVSGTYDPVRHAPFQVAAHGVVGTGHSIIARNLRLTTRNVPVSLAREFGRDLPLGGTMNADAVISGSTSSVFTGTATVTHRDGYTSTIVADGSVAPGDSMRMRLDLRLTPVSLEVVERFAPRVDLRGDVYGFGELRGTPHDLRAELALDLPEGTVDVDGTFDLASDVPSYRATVETHSVDLHAVAPSLLTTSLSGMTTIVGRGVDAKTIDARLTMHMLDAMIDSTQVPEGVVVATVRDARVTVDTMRLRTPFAVATATGTFGLAEGVVGTLNYGIDVNTLSGLERWIDTRDTSLVHPRPLATERASARLLREDSLRRAATDSTIAVLASRREGQKATAPPLPPVQVPGALARDSIAGAVSVRGTVKGGAQRFTAQGRAALTELIWGGNEIGRGTLDFTWADVRTPEVLLTAELGVDSVRAAGFAFDSTHIKATYNDGKGEVAVAVFPGDTAVYRLRARYALRTDEGEVWLQEVNLRFDSTAWASTRESVVHWRGGGLAIDSLELRSDPSGRGGRIFVNGEVPDLDPGRFEVHIDSLRMAPWLTLLQSNVPMDGVASLHATMEGTRLAPRIRGSLAVARHIYGKVPFPDVRAEFSYADRRLQFKGDLAQTAGASVAHLKGDLPIDLSFGDSVEKRILDGPITIDLEGDSIPLGPLAQFTETFAVVTGEARGKVGVRGTWNEPRFEGALTVNMPSLGIRASGVTYANTFARVHTEGDRLVIDTLLTHSGKGFIRATGSVVLEELDHPVLDMRVVANEARVLDNSRGQLVMNSQITLKGPVDTLGVNGSLTIVHGIIRIPDPEQWRLINTGDPALFAVVDTALARELKVAPPSPFMKNANVNVRLDVRRGTWARSREANVEVYGDLLIERETGDEEFSVKGALFSDYGDYDLYGRRFSVTRGSVRFTGPPANPVLQLIAMHQVRQAGRAPFDIQVTIGGTLEQPNISLESQAQPTLTQSDLISFLAFGQSSTSLLQFDGSGVEGGGNSGSSLAGNVAALATRQLAGVAFGAILAELESDITEKTAFDVVHIRPAELPPGLSLSGVRQVALGTQVEIGKYLDRNTFFYGTFRPTFALPGATIERRFGSQFRARASLEPRYLPQVPSLTSGLQPRVQQVIGALLFWTRSW